MDRIRRYGITGCFLRAILGAGRLCGITYYKYLAYIKHLPESIDANSLPSYREITLNDFKEQVKFNREWFNNRKLDQIENRLSQPGYVYYGIYDGDRLMCYGGMSMECDDFVNKKIDVKAAYLFDDYTTPGYRGKGLHQKIISIREYEAWRQNKSATFAYIFSLNKASIRSYQRCGYAFKAKLIYKQIGKKAPF